MQGDSKKFALIFSFFVRINKTSEIILFKPILISKSHFSVGLVSAVDILKNQMILMILPGFIGHVQTWRPPFLFNAISHALFLSHAALQFTCTIANRPRDGSDFLYISDRENLQLRFVDIHFILQMTNRHTPEGEGLRNWRKLEGPGSGYGVLPQNQSSGWPPASPSDPWVTVSFSFVCNLYYTVWVLRFRPCSAGQALEPCL